MALASETIVLSDVPLTNLVHVPHISELELGAKQERKLARITIVRPDGAAYEVHVVALGDCPYAYASKLVHHHRRLRQDFKYQVEVTGEISGPYSADEIIARAVLKKEFGA
jgi:hypothetical protein